MPLVPTDKPSDLPPLPKAPTVLPMSASLVLSERGYCAEGNLKVLAGVFNQFHSRVVASAVNMDAESWPIPQFSAYIKLQHERAKKLQALLSIRAISVNDTPCDGGHCLARFDVETNKEGMYSGDVVIPCMQQAVSPVPNVKPYLDRPNNIIFRVELWISGNIVAYSLIRLEVTPK